MNMVDATRIKKLLQEHAVLLADRQRIENLRQELTLTGNSLMVNSEGEDDPDGKHLADVRTRLAMLPQELARLSEAIGNKDAVVKIETKLLAQEASSAWLAKGVALRAEAFKVLEKFLLGDLATGEQLVSQLPMVRACQVRAEAFLCFANAGGQTGFELAGAFLSEFEKDFAP
jgi:hypothetical protein